MEGALSLSPSGCITIANTDMAKSKSYKKPYFTIIWLDTYSEVFLPYTSLCLNNKYIYIIYINIRDITFTRTIIIYYEYRDKYNKIYLTALREEGSVNEKIILSRNHRRILRKLILQEFTISISIP